jgi:hypothetical protein
MELVEAILQTVVVEPLLLAVSSVIHWRHIQKTSQPPSSQQQQAPPHAHGSVLRVHLTQVLKLGGWWVSIVCAQVLLWFIFVKARHTDEEHGWISPESTLAAHIGIAVLSLPLHVGLLLYSECWLKFRRHAHPSLSGNDEDGEDDAPLLNSTATADEDTEEEDEEEEIFPEFLSSATVTNNPAFERPPDMWEEGAALNRAMMLRQHQRWHPATVEVDLSDDASSAA